MGNFHIPRAGDLAKRNRNEMHDTRKEERKEPSKTEKKTKNTQGRNKHEEGTRPTSPEKERKGRQEEIEKGVLKHDY